MSPPYMRSTKTIRPGATLRLEIDPTRYYCLTMGLTVAKHGELLRMLMAEVGGCEIPKTKERHVQELFDRRHEYSRIRGSCGRSTLAPAIRREVYERDGGRCTYCGAEVEWSQYHCDHVEPVARGGSDEAKNLTTSCRPCNLSKAAKPLSEWRQ